MFNDVAYAMGGLPGGGGGAGGLGSFLPLILMFVVFYFLLIWPQQKKAKAHRAVLANLKNQVAEAATRSQAADTAAQEAETHAK